MGLGRLVCRVGRFRLCFGLLGLICWRDCWATLCCLVGYCVGSLLADRLLGFIDLFCFYFEIGLYLLWCVCCGLVWCVGCLVVVWFGVSGLVIVCCGL